MNVRHRLSTIFATLAIGASLALAGCATTGTQQAEKTTNKMATVENDMKQAMVQVDATSASLRTLTAPEQVGLKRAYDAYSDNVNKMEKVGKQLDKHDNQMRKQGKEYFTEWEKKGNTYTDPQLRTASDERRGELTNIFNQVPQSTQGMKEALNAYLAEIKQIHTYLSTDLTPKGVEAMKPVAEKAIQDGEKLKDTVRPVITAMDRAKTALTQGSTGAAAGGAANQPGAPSGSPTMEQQNVPGSSPSSSPPSAEEQNVPSSDQNEPSSSAPGGSSGFEQQNSPAPSGTGQQNMPASSNTDK